MTDLRLVLLIESELISQFPLVINWQQKKIPVKVFNISH
jgi:hypothetical protein